VSDTATTDTAADPAGAETAADDPAAPEAPDTPAAPETTATDSDTGQDDAVDLDADHFPRHVVEKLRKENAAYRDRAKAAEATVAALQRQAADHAIAAAGMKPEAVWAVAKLDDLLNEQGAVDAGKLRAAMATARNTFGINQRPHRDSVPKTGPSDLEKIRRPINNWREAFAPNRDRR
jgi:hypothetical protein